MPNDEKTGAAQRVMKQSIVKLDQKLESTVGILEGKMEKVFNDLTSKIDELVSKLTLLLICN